MDDDFEFPTAANEEMDEMDVPEDDPVDPIIKAGEEKEIGKNGLKKKLVKEGEGWETPSTGDEVEGRYDYHHDLYCYCFLINFLIIVGYIDFAGFDSLWS